MNSKPQSEDPIRLVIVEPRALLGVGIQEVLDREPDMEVVAHVQTPGEAIEVIDASAPDVVVVDVPMELSAGRGAPDAPGVPGLADGRPR